MALYETAVGAEDNSQNPDGCHKSPKGKKKKMCKEHGGQCKCKHANGCVKQTQGKGGFCIARGGARKCKHPGGCVKKLDYLGMPILTGY